MFLYFALVQSRLTVDRNHMKTSWTSFSSFSACLFAVVLVGFGCATPDYQVATHVNPYTGLRTDVMADNMLEVEEPVRELVWLNASRVFKDYMNYDYYLEVHYEATVERGFLEVTPGPSLKITADGEELLFRTSGSQNSRTTKDDLVSEDALYPTTRDAIVKIASADQVTVQIQGQNGLIQRTFTPENSSKFQEFFTRYVMQR